MFDTKPKKPKYLKAFFFKKLGSNYAERIVDFILLVVVTSLISNIVVEFTNNANIILSISVLISLLLISTFYTMLDFENNKKEKNPKNPIK